MSLTESPSLSVPPPWTPLRASSSDQGVRLDVSGRTCCFGPAAMPTSLVTAGRELLAGPVRLAGRLFGEPIAWTSPYVALLRQDDASAVLGGAVETVGVLISVSVKAEYDGMLRFDVALTPWLSNFRKGAERAAGLEQLWVEIPLRAECARLFTYWPLETGGVVQTMAPVNSNALPAKGLALPFKPMLWLGWEEGGLSWFAESDRGWQPADPQRALEVVPGTDETILRLRLLDSQPLAWRGNADSWYKPNAPVTITFGLQATPVKPMSSDPCARRIVHLNYYESLDSVRIDKLPAAEPGRGTVLDQVVASGANTVVLHEFWNNIQNYWINDRPDEIKATVAAVHARGLKILPYFGYELSTLAPEWADLHERVLIKNADGRFRGGWQRQPPQRDYMVCYGSEWSDRWLEGVAWMLDEYGFDGLYLDGTTMPSACANAVHGCGYVGADGAVRETYPIFRQRRMLQRLYERVEARGGFLTAHQSSCCLTPILGFVHAYWDGEHIGGAFKHDENGRFPLAVFRAEFMGCNFGIPAEFLSGQPESLAYALIHNVMVRPGRGPMLDAVASIWKALGRFGTDHATWLPYWRNADLIQSDIPQVYVSVYVRPERLLLAVSNLSKDTAADATLTLFPAAAGHPSDFASGRDAVTGATVDIRANRVRVTCPPMSWRLIEVS